MRCVVKINRKEVMAVSTAISAVAAATLEKFSDIEAKVMVPVFESDKAVIHVVINAVESVTEIVIPDDFANKAKKFGIDPGSYMQEFTSFRNGTLKLVGFTDVPVGDIKNARCIVADGKKTYLMKATLVKKYLSTPNPLTPDGKLDRKKSKIENKAHKKSTPVPVMDGETIKTSGNAVVKLNAQLKEAGLWRKGCQFLSRDEKTELLTTRSKKIQNRIYRIVDHKLEKIYGTKAA